MADPPRFSYSRDAYAARLAEVARVKVELVAAAKNAAAAAAVRAATAAVDANLAEEMVMQAEAEAAASLDAARLASDDAKSERVARLAAAAKAEVVSRDATPVTPPTNQKRDIGIISYNRNRNAWVMADIGDSGVTAGPKKIDDCTLCSECGQQSQPSLQAKQDGRVFTNEDKRVRIIAILSIIILAIAISYTFLNRGSSVDY